MRTSSWFSFLACGLLGCGGSTSGTSNGSGGGLDPQSVTSIPDGNATGTAMSGDYRVEVYTSTCAGQCGPVQSGLFTVSLCDVGDTDNERLEVTETDGHLQVEMTGPVSRHIGGVNADGTFDIGGYATQQGGSLTIVVRTTGTIDRATKKVTAEARHRSFGTINGQAVDCYGEHDVKPR
jgi:hypothetical protein